MQEKNRIRLSIGQKLNRASIKNNTAIITTAAVSQDDPKHIIVQGAGGLRGLTGAQGEPGQAATITIGTTATLPAGSSAVVNNSGTSTDAVLNFGIPKGEQGDKGDKGQTGADGYSPTASVAKVGDTATITITDKNGTTTASISDGKDGTDGRDGTDGADGAAATIAVGTTSTLAAGSPATVENVGTSSAAVFNFGIPKGDKGDKGDTGATGAAATIAAGTTTTLPAGSSATVTNSGTSSAAVFDFSIPKGDKGDKGDPGAGLVITGSVATYADLPSNLGPSDAGKAYFVEADGKLYVWTGTQFPPSGEGSQFEGPQGPAGQDGAAATIAVGTTTTLPAGSSATVSNSGTSSAAVFNFGIPQGAAGANGSDGADGYSPTASVSKAGNTATITITDKNGTTTTTISDGTNGTNGTNGAAATISAGTTTTLPAGSSASVTNSGTSSAAVFDFGIPKGDTGATGATGADGYSPTASVTKVGTTSTITITDKNGTTTATINDGTSNYNEITNKPVYPLLTAVWDSVNSRYNVTTGDSLSTIPDGTKFSLKFDTAAVSAASITVKIDSATAIQLVTYGVTSEALEQFIGMTDLGTDRVYEFSKITSGGTGYLLAQSAFTKVTSNNIDWTTMDNLFYKDLDVVSLISTHSLQGFGYNTSTEGAIRIAIPMAKRLDNINSWTMDQTAMFALKGKSGYKTGLTLASFSSYEFWVNHAQNCLMIFGTLNGSLGVGTNTPLNFYFELSGVLTLYSARPSRSNSALTEQSV